MLNYGFSNFTIIEPFHKDQPLAKVAVWKGQKDEVQLYPVEEASFLILQSQKNLLKWQIEAPTDITAPITANQPIGKIVFTVSGKPQRSIDLVSRQDVPLAGWFKRAARPSRCAYTRSVGNGWPGFWAAWRLP